MSTVHRPDGGTASGVGLAQQSPPSGGSSGCGSDAREDFSELVEGHHVAGDGQGLGCVPLIESATERAQQRFGWSGQHIIGVGWLIAEADGGVRVLSKMVPAVAETRRSQLAQRQRRSGARQPWSPPQPGQTNPSGQRGQSR